MAWRIHDSVLRGEIDNRTRGVVRGRLWLHGVDQPVQLLLDGNACADLAGCELRFENPGPTTALRPGGTFIAEQRGSVGDMTASRKVKVFDVPIQEACDQLRRGEKPPEHIANCLYLEWFSAANGRIVVESADYRLTLSEPEWRLNPDDEAERRATTERGWSDFLQGLTEAVSREQAKLPGNKAPESWDEFDYEQFLKESDARTEKLMALYDRYEGHPDADAIIAREMGWDSADPNEVRPKPDWTGPLPERIEPTDVPDPDPATEGVDWVRDENGAAVHPLYRRCHRAGRTAWDAVDQMPEAIQNDPDISDFICEFHLATARMAGALNGLAYGRRRREAAFVVACLKRAFGHLQSAGSALDRVHARALLDGEVVRAAAGDLAEIQEGVTALMQEFRGFKGPRP